MIVRSETKNLTFHSLNLLHKLRWNFTTTCHSRVDLGTSDLIYTELISYTKNSIFSHLTQRFCLCDSFLVCECFSHCVYQFFCSPSGLVNPFFWFFSKPNISKVFSVLKYYQRLFVFVYFISQFPGIYFKDCEKRKVIICHLNKRLSSLEKSWGKTTLNQSKRNVM